MLVKGMFITLEGIEGSGKTTQISGLVAFLRHRGIACVQTREPGGTPIGHKIRSILLDPANQEMAALTELFLYEADRSQHMKEVIMPSLGAGKWVVCDRFLDATTAYQGYARGLDVEGIAHIHDRLLSGIRPDLTLLFDLPAAVGLARARSRLQAGEQEDAEARFEKETMTFHERIREGYLCIARSEPGRFRVIDAAGDPERVRERMIHTVTCFLEERALKA